MTTVAFCGKLREHEIIYAKWTKGEEHNP